MIDFADFHVFGGLCAILVFAFWLASNKALIWASPPVVGLIITAALVNLNVLPGPSESEIYTVLGGPTLSAAVFLLLLQVDRKVIVLAGGSMTIAFVLGGVGVFIAALASGLLPGVQSALGESHAAITAMYVGTYTGGGVNFNTLAETFTVARESSVYAVAVGVDNIFTALWLAACTIWAALAQRGRTRNMQKSKRQEAVPSQMLALSPIEISIVALAATAAIFLSQLIHGLIPIGHPLLWLTAIALVAAQTPLGRLGARAEPIAIFALYLFILAIGASVSIESIASATNLALVLTMLVILIIGFHAIAVFLSIRLFGIDSDVALVASQSAIGGPPTAVALAESIGRPDLRIPGAAVGLIGYAAGSYLGVFVHLLITRLYGA